MVLSSSGVTLSDTAKELCPQEISHQSGLRAKFESEEMRYRITDERSSQHQLYCHEDAE